MTRPVPIELLNNINRNFSLADIDCFVMHTDDMTNGTPRITKEKWQNEPLTKGKLEPILADLKDFIKSTAKGTENVLGGQIQKLDRRATLVESRLEATQNYVTKMEHRLVNEINEVKSEMQQVEIRLRGNIQRSEKRLSEKIDKNSERLDDHESRITTLETAHP